MVVASKFDNRLKEFGERWEVDRYLSATGYLHLNVQPFFCALPKVGLPYAGAAQQCVDRTFPVASVWRAMSSRNLQQRCSAEGAGHSMTKPKPRGVKSQMQYCLTQCGEHW